MSDTPRTDKATFNFHAQSPHMNMNQDVVKAEFARELERELAVAQRDAGRYRFLRQWQIDSYIVQGSMVKLDEDIDALIKESLTTARGV